MMVAGPAMVVGFAFGRFGVSAAIKNLMSHLTNFLKIRMVLTGFSKMTMRVE